MASPATSREFWAAWKRLPLRVRREIATAAFRGDRAGEPITGAWIHEYARARVEHYWASPRTYLPLLAVGVFVALNLLRRFGSLWLVLVYAVGIPGVLVRQRSRLHRAIQANDEDSWATAG